MYKQDAVFDIAIIGGGIAGAGIARDACLRGLRTVLFEKNTFGSGTSSKSSKLIHGGIRYLELAWIALKKGRLIECWKNFNFVLSALKESTILEKIAGDLVKPIELVIPIYKEPGQNIWTIYFGSVLYGFLAFFSGNRRFPKILFGRNAVLRYIPNLNPEKLAGGVVIWDHWTQDKRLVEKIIESAETHGAQVFEHAFVKSYQYDETDQIYTIAVELGGETRSFFSRSLINASGPWVDQVRDSAHERNGDFIVPVAGSHITLNRFTDYSVILQANDKRIFFVINMGNEARVGTTERVFKDPDRVKPTEEEVEYLLCALERYFPDVCITSKEVINKDAGIRPLASPKQTLSPHTISREHEIRVGPTGVLHVLGVKLTDHRRAAKEVVNKVAKRLNVRTASKTDKIPL